MTQEHPITPPPELVIEWWNQCTVTSDNLIRQFATQAARWGADQELEACCHLLRQQGFDVVEDLRATRRPKPPSLKEQALEALDQEEEGLNESEWEQRFAIIRRALEALPE